MGKLLQNGVGAWLTWILYWISDDQEKDNYHDIRVDVWDGKARRLCFRVVEQRDCSMAVHMKPCIIRNIGQLQEHGVAIGKLKRPKVIIS